MSDINPIIFQLFNIFFSNESTFQYLYIRCHQIIVLYALSVYQMHFWIPVGIIEKIRKLCFKFLWSGSYETTSRLPWASQKVLANPKFLGGWGMKVHALFAKALAAKSVWNIIHGSGLWVQIVIQKYIRPLSLLDLTKVKEKKKKGISICWKSVL